MQKQAVGVAMQIGLRSLCRQVLSGRFCQAGSGMQVARQISRQVLSNRFCHAGFAVHGARRMQELGAQLPMDRFCQGKDFRLPAS